MRQRPLSRGITPHDIEDEILIRRIAEGDALAFETLYRRYTPRLVGYLTPRLGDPALVDEVCNDVLLVTWRRAAGFRPMSRVSSWIFGIAQRLVRKAKCRSMASQHLVFPEPRVGADHDNPEHLLTVHERTQGVARALATLPTPQRTAVVLAYYTNASYQDIAQRLDCSISTVKMRLAQGRRRLAFELTRLERTPQRARVAKSHLSAMALRCLPFPLR